MIPHTECKSADDVIRLARQTYMRRNARDGQIPKPVPVRVEPPQEPRVVEIYKRIETPAPPPRLNVAHIMKTVSSFYGVSVTDIVSARRTKDVIIPRQMAMYLARRLTPRSLPDIGKRMGDRDHTTVLHGANKIDAMVKAGGQVAKDAETLRGFLTGSASHG